jgi:LPXTG-motif cell wall-anchored protein
MKRHLLLGIVLALTAALAIYPALAASFNFTLVTKIALPGTGGHGDWVAYDPGNDHVYVALHKSGVAVIDAGTNKVVADVEPVAGPNGVAFDDSFVYAAAGDSNELVVISKPSFKIVNRVKTKGTSPDGVFVDHARNHVLVVSDDNNWIEVYSAGAAPALQGTIALQPSKATSGPDVGVLVPAKNLLYQPDDALVEAINLTSDAIGPVVDTKVPLTKTGGTKGMIYDPVTNHIWVGTTGKDVLILDANTLKTVGSAPMHGAADQLSWDPKLRLVYTFEGPAKGFDVFNADTMQPVAFVNTGSGNTHTGDVDPNTHMVYAYEGDANVVGVYSALGPTMLPKTGENPTPWWLLGMTLAAAGAGVRLFRRAIWSR